MKEKSNDFMNDWVDSEEAPELDESFFAQAEKRLGDRLVSQTAFKQAVEDLQIAVEVKLSQDVYHYFRSTGADWQILMNTALKEWIEQHKR